jgi:hypothetical protein
MTIQRMVRRRPLTTPVCGDGSFFRSWWWAPGGRNKKKAKRRSAKHERTEARRHIDDEAGTRKKEAKSCEG